MDQNKLFTQSDPNPYTVRRERKVLTSQRLYGPVFMRNVSHVHKLHANPAVQGKDDCMDVKLWPTMEWNNHPKVGDQILQTTIRVTGVLA